MVHIGKKTHDPIRAGGGLNAHRMVAEVAVEMAQALFEVFAHENAFYRKIRAEGRVTEKDARRLFVEQVAPRLLEDARIQLTSCLSRPDHEVSQAMKDCIYEALCQDEMLRAKRFVAADHATIPSHLH